MATYRKATPADRAQYIDFINLVFSMAHEPHDFKALLPKVYADGRDDAAAHYIAVDDADRIRGLVAVMPDRMRVLDETLNTGYVGSVSVHAYARGEGHMKALMAMAVDNARADGVDLMLLGGLRQRYEYFGFTGGGFEVSYAVTRTNLRHALGGVDASGFAFVPMGDADAALVNGAFALHEARPVRMLRPREDFTLILESWRAAPWIILKGGAFAGYLAASHGKDSVTELVLRDGGDLPAALKAWMNAQNLESVEMSVPAYDFPTNRALKRFAESWCIRCTEKLRVLNFPKVIAAFLKLNARLRPLADGALCLWIDGAPLTLRVQGGAVSVAEEAPADAPRLTAMEAQERFFSPVAAFDGPLAPAGWLPLPLFLYAPDRF